MRIGYGRVSTADQHEDLQRDALAEAACDKVIIDKASGKSLRRTGWERARDLLRPGDTLVVWKLDRLARSLKDLIEVMGELGREGIAFESITEAINTATPGGKLVFHMFGALAEFERNVIIERTKAGLAAARARGRVGGRPKKLSAEQQALMRDLDAQGKHSVTEICRMLGISRQCFYDYRDRSKSA